MSVVFSLKLRELRSKIVRGRDTAILACPECFDGDHPQNRQGMFPVNDPQAIQNPRLPDILIVVEIYSGVKSVEMPSIILI